MFSLRTLFSGSNRKYSTSTTWSCLVSLSSLRWEIMLSSAHPTAFVSTLPIVTFVNVCIYFFSEKKSFHKTARSKKTKYRWVSYISDIAIHARRKRLNADNKKENGGFGKQTDSSIRYQRMWHLQQIPCLRQVIFGWKLCLLESKRQIKIESVQNETMLLKPKESEKKFPKQKKWRKE